MTEEEKKAIEDLKLTIEQEKEELPYSKESLKNNETLLNLIEKLQKENEELRVQGSIILLDYNILKDKIREKIETLKKEATDRLNEGRENIFVTKRLIIDILEELLEEK